MKKGWFFSFEMDDLKVCTRKSTDSKAICVISENGMLNY